MPLKTATIIAIIGLLVSFVMTQLANWGVVTLNPAGGRQIYFFFKDILLIGSLVLFLSVLYGKQQ